MRRIISVLLLSGLILGSISITSAASLNDFTETVSNVNYDEESGLVSFCYDWKWNEVQKLKSADEIQFEWKSPTANLKPVTVSASVDYGDIKTGEFLETRMGEVTTHRWEEALEVSFENIVESDGTKMAVTGGRIEITLEVTEGLIDGSEVHVIAAYIKGKMVQGEGLSTRTSEDSKMTTVVVLSRNGAEEQHEIRSDGWRKSPTIATVLVVIIICVLLAILLAKKVGIKMLMILLAMNFVGIPFILIGWEWVIDTFYAPEYIEFEEHELYLDPAAVVDESQFGTMTSSEMIDVLHSLKPEDIREIRIVHSGDCEIEIGKLCVISEETNTELFRRIVNDFFGEEKQYQITEDMTDIRMKSYSFYITICDYSGEEDMTLFYHSPGVIQWNGQFFVPEKLISDEAITEAIWEGTV